MDDQGQTLEETRLWKRQDLKRTTHKWQHEWKDGYVQLQRQVERQVQESIQPELEATKDEWHELGVIEVV